MQLIFHIYQKQCISRYAVAGTATILGIHYVAELLNGHTATANLHQRSYNCTDHIAKKAVSSYGKTPLPLSYSIPMRLGDGTVIGFGVRIDL